MSRIGGREGCPTDRVFWLEDWLGATHEVAEERFRLKAAIASLRCDEPDRDAYLSDYLSHRFEAGILVSPAGGLGSLRGYHAADVVGTSYLTLKRYLEGDDCEAYPIGKLATFSIARTPKRQHVTVRSLDVGGRRSLAEEEARIRGFLGPSCPPLGLRRWSTTEHHSDDYEVTNEAARWLLFGMADTLEQRSKDR